MPAGRGNRLHVSVECLTRGRMHPHLARGDAHVVCHDGNHARAASLLTDVDCSRPVGVSMSVEARLVRDSIRPTSVDLSPHSVDVAHLRM